MPIINGELHVVVPSRNATEPTNVRILSLQDLVYLPISTREDDDDNNYIVYQYNELAITVPAKTEGICKVMVDSRGLTVAFKGSDKNIERYLQKVAELINSATAIRKMLTPKRTYKIAVDI